MKMKAHSPSIECEGRHHHPLNIGDVILDDDESEAALTHVPAGRDANSVDRQNHRGKKHCCSI